MIVLNYSALSLDILGPALVAGLLILATHVPLGAIVLDRGIIFIDIAIAQVAALGVVFGSNMWGASGWSVQICAVGAAIGCAGLLTWTDKRFPRIQEATIGVIYVFAAAAQILLLAYNPNGSEQIKRLLIGQILWVTPTQLLIIGVVYAAVFAVWYARDLARERLLFYGVFAIVITASVQVVGILLVFASLIVPALATQHAPPRWRLALAFNIGVAGYVIGLVVSAVFDLPTGGAIVCVLIPIAVAAAAVIGMRPAASAATVHDPLPGRPGPGESASGLGAAGLAHRGSD